MLTLLLFSTKSTRQRSKKNTSKGFSWHVQKFPRSSYDCFTGHLALFLGQSHSTATVSCETWLAGMAKGSPCLLAMLCSTSASLALTASSPARCLCLPVFAKCNLAPSGSGSVRHPPLPPSLLSHVAPATFLPPLQSKEMTMLKGDSVEEKTERKPFFLKNLLSENLHILFGELMGNSFSWQLCRSAGDRSSSLSGSHTSYLFKAMSWLSYNLQLFIIQSLAAPVKG